MLITTREVAALLKVHPKHVYRLLKRGLPAHRVGDEWRFDEEEVLRFYRDSGTGRGESEEAPPAENLDRMASPASAVPPPLLAANGDLAVELLMAETAEAGGHYLGHVLADHDLGLRLLQRNAVLVSGCHGEGVPSDLRGHTVARLHLTDREVGLAYARGKPVRTVTAVVGRRLADRPNTAGIRTHLDAALRREGVDPELVHRNSTTYHSHRDVVLAVARGDADVGLSSRAWAVRLGLGFLPLAAEAYGLIVKAECLGSPGMTALCEAAQRGSFRKRLSLDHGYDSTRTGELRITTGKGTP